jgi:hypothetical protein
MQTGGTELGVRPDIQFEIDQAAAKATAIQSILDNPIHPPAKAGSARTGICGSQSGGQSRQMVADTLADRVKRATVELNGAIEAAVRAGLMVKLEVLTAQSMTGEMPVLTVRVFEPA